MKVTFVPAQMVDAGEAAIDTAGATDELTVIVMLFDVAVDEVAQFAEEVITHVTTSLLASVVVV